MPIIKHRKIFFAFSALLIAGSIAAISVFGFHLSSDFVGGSLLEVSFEQANQVPTVDVAKTSLAPLSLGEYSLRPSGDTHLVLRSKELTEEQKDAVVSALSSNGTVPTKIERFNTVGPIVGQGLKKKSFVAIAVVVACIMAFITIVFRKVSEPVASWKYGLATIIALAHDVIIPTGIYVVYGHYFGAEIDLLFVTALLAILGYSVHDTIVVFDRTRENLTAGKKESFEETVGKSLSQTMARSINTSVTTFITLAALYFVGSEATQNFAFTLLTGVIVGTYSSVFVASPLLVTLEKLQKK
jgi:preprotein translocase subunit SecF